MNPDREKLAKSFSEIRKLLKTIRNEIEEYDLISGVSLLDNYTTNTLDNVEDQLTSLEVYIEEVNPNISMKEKDDTFSAVVP